MAHEEYYCGCGKKTEDSGLCESCSARWEREKERIHDYVENNNLGYGDQQKIESNKWDNMGLGSRVVRYCSYRGSCGNIIEDWAEYCPSCTEAQRQYEIDEEQRRRRAIEDY